MKTTNAYLCGLLTYVLCWFAMTGPAIEIAFPLLVYGACKLLYVAGNDRWIIRRKR